MQHLELKLGGWETRGGHRRKSRRNGGGVRWKIKYTRGTLLFSFPFINWKKGRGAIRV